MVLTVESASNTISPPLAEVVYALTSVIEPPVSGADVLPTVALVLF